MGLVKPFHLNDVLYVINNPNEYPANQLEKLNIISKNSISRLRNGKADIHNYTIYSLSKLSNLVISISGATDKKEDAEMIDLRKVMKLVNQNKVRPQYIETKTGLSKQLIWQIIQSDNKDDTEQLNKMRLKTYLALNKLNEKESELINE